MNIDSLMRAVNVRRWHTESQIGDETDGHHSAVVALIADDLAIYEDTLPPIERYYLLRESLRHDLGEYWTGDLPAPGKKVMPKELLEMLCATEAQFKAKKLRFSETPMLERSVQILALADTLAAAVHCARQALMGNREGIRILRILCDYLRTHIKECKALQRGTLLRAVQLMRECAMIADSDVLLVGINGTEEFITCPEKAI